MHHLNPYIRRCGQSRKSKSLFDNAHRQLSISVARETVGIKSECCPFTAAVPGDPPGHVPDDHDIPVAQRKGDEPNSRSGRPIEYPGWRRRRDRGGRGVVEGGRDGRAAEGSHIARSLRVPPRHHQHHHSTPPILFLAADTISSIFSGASFIFPRRHKRYG